MTKLHKSHLSSVGFCDKAPKLPPVSVGFCQYGVQFCGEVGALDVAVALLPQSEWQAVPSDAAQDEDLEESDSDEPEPATAAAQDACSTQMQPVPSVSVDDASEALEHQLQLEPTSSAQSQHKRQQVWNWFA